jgi:hypothetical protein
MKRGYVDKLSAIIVGVIHAIFCVLIFSSVQTISTAYAQGQTAAGEPDQIKTLLLRPGGWEGDYRGPGAAGEIMFLFEIRGEKIVAKVSGKDSRKASACTRDVIISSDVVKFDSCRTIGITVQFDPNDPVYPFKGRSPDGFEWRLKVK